MRVGAEIAQADERLAAGVFHFDARRRGLARDEYFVFSLFAETDHGRCLQVQPADPPAALHGDPAASAGVLQCTLRARLDRQLFGTEELLSVNRAVDDP